MAIKKLTFTRGEELGIRTKGKRLDPADVLENMKQYLEQTDKLIIRCGKSFYDITDHPEIFEEGEEFREEEMTSIDKKQMQRPAEAKPAYQDDTAEKKAENPLADLYHRTDEPENKKAEETLIRRTYIFRPTDIEAVRLLNHELGGEISALVREALARGLNSIAEEIGSGDIYARAEQSLAKRAMLGEKSPWVNN